MENLIDGDLIAKLEIISQGPNRDLLRRLVEILFKQEQYDDDPLSPEEEIMVESGLKALQDKDKSSFMSLAEYEKERGL
jgi:hypothetical protein